MANTFSNVEKDSFQYYAFEFSKLIIEWGERVPAPCNLFMLPTKVARSVRAAISVVGLVFRGAMVALYMTSSYVARHKSEPSHAPCTADGVCPDGEVMFGSAFHLKEPATSNLSYYLSRLHRMQHHHNIFAKKVEVGLASREVQPRLNMVVVRAVHKIRLDTIRDEGSISHFRKALSRYCKAQASVLGG